MKYIVVFSQLNQVFTLQHDKIDGIIKKKQLKDMHNDEARTFMTKLFHAIDIDKSGFIEEVESVRSVFSSLLQVFHYDWMPF